MLLGELVDVVVRLLLVGPLLRPALAERLAHLLPLLGGLLVVLVVVVALLRHEALGVEELGDCGAERGAVHDHLGHDRGEVLVGVQQVVDDLRVVLEVLDLRLVLPVCSLGEVVPLLVGLRIGIRIASAQALAILRSGGGCGLFLGHNGSFRLHFWPKILQRPYCLFTICENDYIFIYLCQTIAQAGAGKWKTTKRETRGTGR